MGAYPASRTQQLQHQHTQPLVQLLIDSVLDTWDPPYNMCCGEKPIGCSGDMIVCYFAQASSAKNFLRGSQGNNIDRGVKAHGSFYAAHSRLQAVFRGFASRSEKILRTTVNGDTRHYWVERTGT
ncbi:hypothetical protein PVAP13_3NG179553 [Panicum virgatum]|uniref:Uncharacterized protein n=1 Tax=Panicum virgatum TaxID=38727 RepID=A0A8T0U8B7_PANVG|nr:hypothetical protein PVAP13_3NG179553 [Panicum virgatum]